MNQVLNRSHNAKKETRLWVLGQRLLGLITILELKDYDWFEYRLECFRKTLQSLNGDATTRIKLVYRLLKELIKHNYDYRRLVNREQQTIDCLTQVEGPNAWDPMGMEVVEIPQWLLNKSLQ